MYTILLVIHTIVVIFLILMILIQRTDSDGMGGLGGGGGNQFMTGRATANLMTRTTAFLAATFMISSLILAVYAGHANSGSIIDAVPVTETAPAKSSIDDKFPADDKDTLVKEKATEDKADAKPAQKSKHADKAEKPAAKSTPSVPKPE